MSDETGIVEYVVRFSGDVWDHEAFREMVHEHGGEIEEERTIGEAEE